MHNPKMNWLQHILHADENAVMPKTPKTDIVASNVLKMRRHVYEDEKNIPIAMFELPDPKKIAMYPKSKVYSGGTEYSLEELRAIIYLKREKERQKQSHENKDVDMSFETQDAELKVSFEEKVVSINGDQNYISEERHCQQLNIQQEEVCISERTEMKQLCQNNNFEIYTEAEEEMNAKMKQRPLKEFQQKERIPAAAPVQTSFLKDLPASGFLKVPRTILERKESMVPSTDDMFYSGPSFEQKESDQSLTVHTKAVLNEVKGMWVSSPQAESNPPREQASIVNVHFGKEAEGRKMEKEREVEIAENRKQVSQPGFPQRNPLSRNLFHTPSSNNRHDPDDVEMQAMEQNSESALYKERGIFKSSNQEPTSFPRNSSEDARDQDTHRDDFKIFKVPSAISVKQDKEMSKPAMEIPFVPSPGMTPGQLEALKGTEDKENMLREKSEQMPQLSRSKKSILQPSKDVYFVPLEQQLAEDDMSQGNVLSDETCCTEAFAIPLVSSTPMLHPHLKTKVHEAKPNQEEEQVDDNTMNLIAYLQQKNIRESVLPANGTNTKPQLVNQTDNVTVVPNSTRMPRMSAVTTQLSTILESSDRRKSSMGTIDGSGSSKSSGCDTISKYNNTRKSISSAYHQICELELQEEIDMFRNIDHNQRPSPSGSLMFFSGSFRSRCWESSGFPSEVHKMNCVELHMPFDINIRGGSSFVLGENRYQVFEVISEETGMLSFFAYEDFSKRRVYMELKDNAYLWEQYIREEIKLRVRDKSKLQHFDINDKTYIFANKFLRVFEKDAKKGRCIKDILEQTFDVTECASEILNIVFHLHQCKIVHGSLSLESFMFISDDLFLNCFEKAVDLTLLPSNTVFDATEEPLYHKLRAHKLSPFQVDYIALANILHQLVFKEPMKVHEEMGKNYDKTLWDILFTELLNSSDVNLLQFCYALEQGINS
ncbi:Mitotic checkpoint serine/threonine-protein kinase BUB1 [Gryllus bimaculatus]|nr:Mitotic checkpoint serine/threonine-protein kinase BUB1 [Gryllus bimaculatus]